MHNFSAEMNSCSGVWAEQPPTLQNNRHYWQVASHVRICFFIVGVYTIHDFVVNLVYNLNFIGRRGSGGGPTPQDKAR